MSLVLVDEIRHIAARPAGTSNWSAQLYVDFNDPNASWWNALSATVDVNHGGSHTQYTIYNILGNGGTTSDSGTKSVNFTAVNGDTVTITVSGRISFTDSHARFGGVHVFRVG